MRIGIDITPIIYEGTGVGDYTRHFVAELLSQNTNDEFVLFYSTLRGFGKMKEKVKEILGKGNQGDEGENYRIIGLPIPPWVWQIIWNKLNLIKIEWLIGKLDVFHCWDYLIPPSKCKRVITIHDATPFLFPETHEKKLIKNYQLILKKIIKEKIQVITVSENSKKDLIKFGIDEKLVTVIYNGNNFQAKEDSIEYQKDNYILAVGTRNPRKNLSRIIEAYAGLIDKHSEIELRLVGKFGRDNIMGQLNSKRIEQLGQDKIKILGFVSDEKLVELYRHATCLVYPSLYEGFGLPILEAMSLGCPVITSNISSIPEVGGDAVIYVDSTSEKEISDSMIRIIESEELRKDLIKKGLEQAKKFSWSVAAKKTREVYEKVVSSK